MAANLRQNERALRQVHPNAGIQAEYRKRILAIVDEMGRSYAWWLRAQYRQTPPRLAMDRLSPAEELLRELRKLGGRWRRRINETAPKLAEWFAKSAGGRSQAALRKILRDGGFSVKFKITPTVRDVLDAIVAENVSLIRSIPEQFHTQVEGLVMRSVTTGRDLQQLTKDLQKQFGVTRKRAELIARDQNNKATSAMLRVRQTELGIAVGVWMHSHAGKEPRPTHVGNDGKKFSIANGWFDPDPRVKKRIWPGELINCRCTWRPIVKGFS